MASLIRERGRPRKPWRVDWTERRRRRTQRFATRAEAEAFIGDLARTAHRRPERVTVREWFLRWLEAEGPRWEPRTVTDRAAFADRWIFRHLGNMLIGEVTRADVRDMRGWMRRKGATVYTANRVVQVLSAALGAAVDDGLIPANPCRGLKPLPREKVQRRRAATPAEVEAIRLGMLTDRDRVIVSLMAYAGLRPSEVYSLRWEDVRTHTLSVQSAQRAETKAEKETKTGSTRPVPIIPSLADDLEALEQRPDGLVVGPLDHRHWTSRQWSRAREVAGTPEVVPYSLRHTFASLLIAEGRNPWQVAALMGHANPQMVITTYGHLFAEAELADPVPMADTVAEARHAAPTILRARLEASPS